MKALLEFLAFWSGWMLKGVGMALIAEGIYKPLARLMIKRASDSESHFIAAYIVHHVKLHPEIKYPLCSICATLPTK